ncbi:MAG: hypothetical protein WDW38_004955 [Sanguina aurantia]
MSPGPGRGRSLRQSFCFDATECGLRVGYQGVPGAYGEAAAHKAAPLASSYVPYPQFSDVCEAVSSGAVDSGILPFTNSTAGPVTEVHSLLHRSRLFVTGEIFLAVTHCLTALPGTSVADLTRIMSHPQALAQCKRFLGSLANIAQEAVSNTGVAAQTVSTSQLVGVGALCSRRAAELYGLEVLLEGVQDAADNVTQFVLLSRERPMHDGVTGTPATAAHSP